MRSTSFLTVTALVTLIALMGAFADSVSASVPGLKSVANPSDEDSRSPKTATVDCPPGKRVVGVSAQITPGAFFIGGQVALESLVPVGNSVLVQASEDQSGFSGDWMVTARANCADLPGLHVVRGSPTTADSVGRKRAFAQCPDGEQAIGAGGVIIGAIGQVRINHLDADATGRAQIAADEDEDGFSGTWALEAHAICARPISRLERVFSSGSPDSASATVQSADCPPGKQLLSPGVDILGIGPLGAPMTGHLGLITLVPSPAPGIGQDVPPVTALAVAAEDETGLPLPWFITTSATCA
jgi:hypothetical protein